MDAPSPRAALVVAAALTLGLSGCLDREPPPLEQVEEGLVQLAERAEAFSLLRLDDRFAAAYAVDGDTLSYWHLTPRLREEGPGERARLGISFEELPPSDIAARAHELAEVCPDFYRLQVSVVTAAALQTSVTCPDGGERSWLGGRELPLFDTQWTPERWQELLDLTVELNGSPMVEAITVDGESVRLDLADTAVAHGCRPSISLLMGGPSLTAACLAPLGELPGTLAGWSGESLARAVDQVAAAGGITPGEQGVISLRPQGDALQITVTDGDDTAREVVEPG